MQTISIPFACSDEDKAFLRECRRVYSAAVRSAYAHAVDEDGKLVKQKPLRDFVKSRFAGGSVDAWVLHCATLEALDMRKLRPDGKIIFGGRKNFEQRLNHLIDNEEWRPRVGDAAFFSWRASRLAGKRVVDQGQSLTFINAGV